MSALELRPDLVELTGYHSAQVEASVRLNTNESPFEPPEAFIGELLEGVEAAHLNRYPDREALDLRSAIASHAGVRVDEVFAANGSNEVLQCLLLAYGGPGRRALVFEPTYTLHSHIARITGTGVHVRRRDEDFRLSPGDVASVVVELDPAIVFLCSPNNPTGIVEPIEVIEAALASSRGLVVVDEAYGQFADSSAMSIRDLPGADRLVVIRTFSKTWAMAGVRLGYSVGSAEITRACFQVVLPYHLSSITQLAGRLALRFDAEMQRNVAAVTEERGRLITSLRELEVDVWPSSANFILFRPRSTDGHLVWERLVERSVLIRDCSSWNGLEGCLRVTVGSAAENDAFIEALEEIL